MLVKRNPSWLSIHNGRHTGSREGAVIGFDHMSGPHTKGVWTGISCPVVQQGVESLMGKVTTSAECMNCDMLLPVPGRSDEHSRKGTP